MLERNFDETLLIEVKHYYVRCSNRVSIVFVAMILFLSTVFETSERIHYSVTHYLQMKFKYESENHDIFFSVRKKSANFANQFSDRSD